jgi:oxygen-dependent protoporphyrinogen oxidase
VTDRFAVVGGGVAGLAAAWELVRRRPGAEITVFEPGPLGGKLRTSPFAGRLVDEGADAFLARVPEGRDLCAELGLDAGLVSPATANVYVAAGDRLHRLPEGLVLGVPVDAGQLRGSPLVGPEAADRVAAEPDRPGRPLGPDDDPSVGELVRSRLGDDVLEHLVDPLIGGINAGDTDRLSVRAAAPQIAAAAERSASLVEGLRSAPPSGPPGSPVFWALPGGMASLVEALVGALRAAGVAFVAEAVDDPRSLVVDGVVVATPAPAAAALVGAGGAADAAGILAGIDHSSPVLVTLALPVGAVRHQLDASGVLVPRTEGRLLTACSFATTKWAHLHDADPSTVVLRASAGRTGDDRAIHLDDAVLVAGLLADLDELLGLDTDPLEVRISRWRDGFPQYAPGHLGRIAAVESDLASRLPRARLAGASLYGIGIPACIRSARAAAASLAP